MGVDPIRIRDLLGHIVDAQRRLRELGALPEAAYLGDFRNTASAKYLFIVAIEAAIDLCNHIVAHQGGRAPQAYADCFDILAELCVIELDLARRLKRMARFRNLLYRRVDDRRVYQVIHDNLDDLDVFRRQVLAWLASQGQ